MISIVITTFDRAKIVPSAIDSALKFCVGYDDEIIIVDDCSLDNTKEVLQQSYLEQIKSGLIRIVYLKKNLGVTGAKNAGAFNATKPWIIFLDSDDQLVFEASSQLRSALSSYPPKVALVFFQSKLFSGRENKRFLAAEYELNLDDYIKNGTFGECLPAVRRDIFLQYPYHSDMRGFEGLSYFSILHAEFRALINPLVARKYSDMGNDTLSALLGQGGRSRYLIIGYFRMLKIGFNELGVFSIFTITGKLLFNIARYFRYLLKI